MHADMQVGACRRFLYMKKAILYLDNDLDGKDKRNMGVNMQVERQHVLTKKEKAVMRVIYQEAEKQNGSCLLTPIDIFEKIPLDLDFEEDELDTTLRNLEIDDYFDITRSDKKGELVYCINMQKKGLQFARVERAFKSNLTFKILLTLGLSVVTALIGVGIRMLVAKIMGQ